MKNRNIHKLVYRLRHQVFTLNNLVIAVAAVIALGWVWGSIGVMQRNFGLQRELDAKKRQLQLVTLESDTLRLQQRYYKSDEYKELAVRERLGLVQPGEHVLVLPPNTKQANTTDSTAQQRVVPRQPSNFEQWMTFFFGKKTN